ncbi:TonB-linked outer membrane protein, SusC/RagA family [Salegentibacter holothuriorum]|uniref:TonB-linked outer membrane protein, SusC/RagA family n=2 Tax=Salegentibacter holothuriorum TaxID=241145 RepID=A0A1T5DKA8_9FLAO|nr:TonB-linked outer membrane protein, SusC/RagA family [Salegentibacter holothuriorum]
MMKNIFTFCMIVLSCQSFLFAQESITVQGKVTETDTGVPIPSANIIEKGTSNGVMTNFDGEFSIKVPANATLSISYIGYATKEVPVQGRTNLNIQLQTEAAALEEVVVVGYGTQKKANLTGAVTTVDSDVLQSRPVPKVSQMLQGVVPGLNFQTSGLGGELNSGLNFNIRGAGTIGSGSNSAPLVLVDGMEASLDAINPQTIESITVLKDAAASAVYGSRAAFGVILVTTKDGQSGAPRVSYSNNFRFTSPIQVPEMMDSHTFALYWNEAATNAGQAPPFSQEVIDRIIQYQAGEIDYGTVPNANGDRYQYYTGSHANTDWFDELYKDFSFSQEHNLSLSGGSESTTYYTSARIVDQVGLLKYGEDRLDEYDFTGKLSTEISKHVKFNYSTRFSRNNYNKSTQQGGLFYHNIARRWPTVPVRDPNGYFTDSSGEIIQLEDGGRTDNLTDRLFMQGQLTITPIEGWNIYAIGNYKITNMNNHVDVLPAYGYDVAGNPYPVSVGWNSPGYSSVYEYNRKEDYFSTNIYSDYVFDINQEHNFKVMAGFNSEITKYRTIGASRSGLITPDLPTINTATDESRATEGQYQHWSVAGFFGRLNYNFKEKYLLELNARYDGSSRFINDKRWNLFPSISAGWNIAKEDFWKWDSIQLLKLRGSYGELGNQNTSNWYPFYQSMPIGTANGGWLLNGERPNTASAPGLVSSLLTWERVTSWNVGLDMALLKNRLNLSAEYFNRKTLDMVGPAPQLPNILGTAVPRINNADMESYGFELEINWRDKIGDFNYSARGVLSDSQQKVVSYPNPTDNIWDWYNGRKMGEIWGYTTVGIAKTDEEMQNHLANTNQSQLGSDWQAGDIMYADLNGDGEINSGNGTLDDTGDLSILGNSTPRYRFGLDLNGDFKGFDFRVFIEGFGKRDYMPNGPYFWGANGGMWQSAGFEEHMDYFRNEESPMVQAGLADVNLDAYYPRPSFRGGKNQQTQSRYIQDASYIRLKNVQLGYSFNSYNDSRIRVYVSGENLLTFSNMIDIFDPESVGLGGWSDGKTYPYSQVLSVGLNVNF